MVITGPRRTYSMDDCAICKSKDRPVPKVASLEYIINHVTIEFCHEHSEEAEKWAQEVVDDLMS